MSHKERVAELRPIHARHREALLALPNAHMVDIGFKYVRGAKTDTIAIRVHVTHKTSVADPDAVPKTLEGQPTDVIETQPPERLVSAEEKNPEGYFDPLVGGVEIGRKDGRTVYWGTVGGVVVDRTSQAPLALSNHHVLYGETGETGAPTQQPARTGPQPLGKVLRGVGLGQGTPPNFTVDAAVSSVGTRKATWLVNGLGPVRGTSEAELGARVVKSGANTRLTVGEVDSVSAWGTLPTLYDDQIMVKSLEPGAGFSLGGDSGSFVLNENNEVVGLLWAGNPSSYVPYGLVCPISNVEQALNVSVLEAPKPEPNALTSVGAPQAVYFQSRESSRLGRLAWDGTYWALDALDGAEAETGSALASWPEDGRSQMPESVFCLSAEGVLQVAHEGTSWRSSCLSNTAEAPGARSGSALAVASFPQPSVFYVASNGHAICLTRASGTWSVTDLSASTAAGEDPVLVEAGSSLAALGNPVRALFCVNSAGHIQEFWHDGEWQKKDLTAAAAGSPPPAAGRPLVCSNQGSQYIYYVGDDGHLHALYYNGSWKHVDLTQSSGAPTPLATGGLTCFGLDDVAVSETLESVFFVGSDGDVHQVIYQEGAWRHYAISTLAKAGSQGRPGPTSALTCYRSAGIQSVVYVDRYGSLCQLFWTGKEWRFTWL